MIERRTTSRARRLANASIFGLTLGALISFAGAAAAAPVLPTGGQVAAGQASIAKTGSTLTIDQTSSRAIINWSNFSIGKGGTVQFDNGSGATLNRVTGAFVSSINGLLSATGSVYLINPNGVIIGKSGVVNTGGTFVASTQDLTNAEFLTGGTLTFSGNSPAEVLNLGKVGSLGGDVTLIASKVENDGTITAGRGDVGLVAGYQVVMSDATQNGGEFQVLLGGSGTSATNTGSIRAAEAELRANGGNVFALAGNTGGIIDATGVSTNDGKVLLIAENGSVTANGTIIAKTATGAGGEVETSGQTVNFAGLTVKAGSWMVDPENLTISGADADTLSTALSEGTSVTLQTTASGAPIENVGVGGTTSGGAGDIIIASAVNWSSGATLTLDAFHSIAIDAPITTNGGGVVLNTNFGNAGGGGGYGFGLTAAGFQGSLNFTNASGSLTINGTSFTLEATPAALVAAINANNSGNFALAASGNLGTSSGAFIPIFSGDFTGLGHTITGMTIDDTSANGIDGLFGQQTAGVISDIGLVGGSVSASLGNDVGDLLGDQLGGSISDAYATGSVSGNNDVGGLVGSSAGSISDAYATGAVSGSGSVGGLVGAQFAGSISDAYATGTVSGSDAIGGLVGGSGGSITDAYATGAVSGSLDVGGLVGVQSGGSITDAYATGAVSGSEFVGGLVGVQSGDTIIDGYYDAGTTGQMLGMPGDGSIGMTTAALQGVLPALQNSGLWSTGPGLYPILTNFFPNGAVAISGVAYSGQGVSPLSTSTVTADLGGASLGSVTSGANGYYYFVEQAGTISAGGSPTLIYTSSGARLQTLTGTTGGLDIWGQTFIAPTADLTLSAAGATTLQTQDAALLASAEGSDTTAATLVAGLTNQGYIATGASFTIGAVGASLTLANGLYVETTAAGAPITVAAALALPGSEGLNLEADGALAIDAPITVSGAGVVSLAYDPASPTNFSFGLTAAGFAGSLSFTGAPGSGQALSINGQAYTLLYALADGADTAPDSGTDDIAGIDHAGDGGFYALAVNLNGTGTTFTSTLAGVNGFTGVFEGLGHTITGLTINDTTDSQVGLFGINSGTIRDIGLIGDTVTGTGDNVGGLVGFNFAQGGAATITDAYATGVVSGGVDDFVGGLVGTNSGSGPGSVASITNAYATGAVSGSVSGGGEGSVGGLAGVNIDGGGTATISDAYATGTVSGSVSGGGQIFVGGLVGANLSTGGGAVQITDTYATGAVSVSTNTSGGATALGLVGGLVGLNESQSGTTSITDAYATGAVSANASGSASAVGGGLVGDNANTGGTASSVADAYATGAVSGSGVAILEGLVGFNSGGVVSNSFWDVLTTGQMTDSAQATAPGSINGFDPTNGSIGLTTSQLQGLAPLSGGGVFNTQTALGSAFGGGTGGLYPFLTSFFPNGVQAISGFAFTNGGTTAAAGASVSAIANGTAFGSASAGANGYYYIFAPAGSVASGQSLLTYAAATDSATLTTAAGAGAGVQTGLNLYGGAMTVPTTVLTLSTAPTLTQAQASGIAADGSITAAATVIGDTTALGLVASGASFTVDVAPTTSLVVKTTAGSITVDSAPFTLGGSDYLTLDSFKSIAIDTLVTFSGAGAVDLVTNDGGSGGDYSFDGNISFTSESSDPSLTINGARYTLIFTMAELVSDLNGSSGDFALADSLTATTDFTGAVVGSFGGIFTGLAHSISGLTITGTSADAALFGTLDGGGEVRDFLLLGGSVAGGVGVGALVGNDGGELLNDTATTAVSGTADVGGLAGFQASIGFISASSALGSAVSGMSGVGGLVGKNTGIVESSVGSSTVAGERYVGGLVGYNSGALTGGLALGAVTGTGSEPTDIGGVAGYNSGDIAVAVAQNGNVSGTAFVGGLVGVNAATGTLSGDTASAVSVAGTNVVGGLAGENLGTIESGSSSSDGVSGSRYVGGLVGFSTGTIEDASASGSVTGTTEVGGLVGFNSGNISAASAASGNVSGTNAIGGLVGANSGEITAAQATGAVTGTGSEPVDLGGLVGENEAAGVITESQATGGGVSAPGGVHLGGLVGVNAGQISQSFATETVGSDGTGIEQGGLVGENTASGMIANTYATGEVEAGTDIGGLVGANFGAVQTSWTSGAVASGATAGGVVGANAATGVFTDVYWDVGTTGRADPLAVGTLGSSANVTGIGGTTGENPDSQATYAGFNFSTFWTIDPGTSRPFLLNVIPQTPPN